MIGNAKTNKDWGSNADLQNNLAQINEDDLRGDDIRRGNRQTKENQAIFAIEDGSSGRDHRIDDGNDHAQE